MDLHRTASVNEYSARYSILDREFYIPEIDKLAAQANSNRQGRGKLLEANEAARVLDILRSDAARNYNNYLWMLNEDQTGEPMDKTRLPGLARELARINLTLNAYTQWYWKCDLYNSLNFLRLRTIFPTLNTKLTRTLRDLLSVVERWVPLCFEAFTDYRLEGVSLSRSRDSDKQRVTIR